jgi:hypothetical protein
MRFEARHYVKDIWYIFDTKYKDYNLPQMAVSIYLPEIIARQIAGILNRQWTEHLEKKNGKKNDKSE